MAHSIEYKHPDADLIISVDSTDALPSDTGLKAMGTVATNTSTISVVDSAGTITTGATEISVSGVTATTSMVMTVTAVNGLDGQDYVIQSQPRGNTTTKPAVRLIEVRVRENLGIGAL